jgi:hypothetical protein
VCSSPSIMRMINSRKMRGPRHVARMAKSNAYRIWWENQKKPLGRPRRRMVHNIKTDLRYDGMVRRVKCPSEHGNEPSGSVKC